jgi:hypothetical protein
MEGIPQAEQKEEAEEGFKPLVVVKPFTEKQTKSDDEDLITASVKDQLFLYQKKFGLMAQISVGSHETIEATKLRLFLESCNEKAPKGIHRSFIFCFIRGMKKIWHQN